MGLPAAARVQSGAALAGPLYIEASTNPRSGSCNGQILLALANVNLHEICTFVTLQKTEASSANRSIRLAAVLVCSLIFTVCERPSASNRHGE